MNIMSKNKGEKSLQFTEIGEKVKSSFPSLLSKYGDMEIVPGPFNTMGLKDKEGNIYNPAYAGGVIKSDRIAVVDNIPGAYEGVGDAKKLRRQG